LQQESQQKHESFKMIFSWMKYHQKGYRNYLDFKTISELRNYSAVYRERCSMESLQLNIIGELKDGKQVMRFMQEKKLCPLYDGQAAVFCMTPLSLELVVR
jgi:hypothetical protein